MATFELIRRFGSGSTMPSELDLVAAAHEVLAEDNPACTESDYREHPSAWLTYGYQDGEKWVVHMLELDRTGTMRYLKMADQDDAEPEFEKVLLRVAEDCAVRLWRLLLAKNLQEVMSQPWSAQSESRELCKTGPSLA
jgi:hypothetical protein